MSAPSRVILGATCFADAKSAMDLAVQVAARFQIELSGMLIEDRAMLQLAGMPRACFIDQAGRRSAVEDAEAMQDAIRRDAETFRRALARQAEAQALRWSFVQRPMTAAEVLRDAVRTGSFLVLGGAPAHRRSPEIVVLQSADPDLAALAAELAEMAHGRLRVLNALREGLRSLGPASVLLARLSDLPEDLRPHLAHARFTRLILGPVNADVDKAEKRA